MSTNNYLHKTAFDTFQTLGYGDRIWPDVETENWQKVENKLLAMNLENYLIYRGTFTYPATRDLSGITQITLSPNAGSAFEGCINGMYYNISQESLVWNVEATSPNDVFYLYLKEVTGAIDPEDGDSLEKEFAQSIGGVPPYSGEELDTRLVMAIVTISSNNITVNTTPEGQLTQGSFLNHVIDTEDPHGTTLTQSNLNITDTLTIKSTTVYQELVYDVTINATTNTEYNLDTILGLVLETTTVHFVGNSPLTSCPIPVWFEYDEYELNKFTIHNDNSTQVQLKLFIKYTQEEV